MEKIFIVGKADEYIKNIDLPIIELPAISTDEQLHEFIENELKNVDFERLIIPINGDGIKTGLRLGLHIRLTASLQQKRLCTILFISDQQLTSIIKEAGVYGQILSTKGCQFEMYTDKKTIQNAIRYAEGLRADDYKINFLRLLNIGPDGNNGKHSLANQWGALSLAKASGIDPQNIGILSSVQKKLYVKFLTERNYYSPNNAIQPSNPVVTPNTINCAGKKILLIDDEASKGWEEVLRTLFKVSNPDDFKVIKEEVRDYAAFSRQSKHIIEQEEFDLYLVDLRLNGLNEDHDENVEPSDFSGTKVLRQIKQINKGNQVIIFTASNKAWNMKQLMLSFGADGYYIKESPEYNFPAEFSKENYLNFKKDVETCFELSFLRPIAKSHITCNQDIDTKYTTVSTSYKNFYGRSKVALEIAFELLKKSSIDKKYFDLAYLVYYQILEDYASQHETFRRIGWETYVVNGASHVKVIDNSGNWKLRHYKDAIDNYGFFKRERFHSSHVVASFARISFILAFKFSKNDIKLKEWGRLNDLRNKAAAHGGNSHVISNSDLSALIELVELFLTS